MQVELSVEFQATSVIVIEGDTLEECLSTVEDINRRSSWKIVELCGGKESFGFERPDIRIVSMKDNEGKEIEPHD